MATDSRTSPLRAFVKSPVKHLVHDGWNQVPHSNTIKGHDHKENPKSKVVNQTKKMLEEETKSKA